MKVNQAANKYTHAGRSSAPNYQSGLESGLPAVALLGKFKSLVRVDIGSDLLDSSSLNLGSHLVRT